MGWSEPSLSIPTALSEPETHLPAAAVGADAERSGYSGSRSCPRSAGAARGGGSGAKPCFRSNRWMSGGSLAAFTHRMGPPQACHVKPRRRDGRAQPHQEVVRLEGQRVRSVLPDVFQRQQQPAVLAPPKTLLRQRGAQYIAAKPFQLRSVSAIDDLLRVQVNTQGRGHWSIGLNSPGWSDCMGWTTTITLRCGMRIYRCGPTRQSTGPTATCGAASRALLTRKALFKLG